MAKKSQPQNEQEAQENLAQEAQNEQEAQESSEQESSEPQNTQNAESTPQASEGAKDFSAKLEAALESSQWREQVRLTLCAIQEVYLAFVALDESYQTGLKSTSDAISSLTEQSARVDVLATQTASAIDAAKKDFISMQKQANDTLTQARDTAQTTAINAQTTTNNLIASESIWDKTREMGEKILQKEGVIVEAFEKWKTLEAKLENANVLKAELDTKLEAHRSKLNEDKEGYENELIQKKDEITRKLDELSTQKNSEFSQKVDELNQSLETHKQNIQTASTTLATSYDDIKAEILGDLALHFARVRESESPYFYQHSGLTKANQASAFLALQIARATQKYALLHQNAKILDNDKIVSFWELYQNAKKEYENTQNEPQAQESSEQESSEPQNAESTESTTESTPPREDFPSYEVWLSSRFNSITLATLKTHSKLFALPSALASLSFTTGLNASTSTMQEIIEALLSEAQKAEQENKKLEFIDTLIAGYERDEATKLTKYAVS